MAQIEVKQRIDENDIAEIAWLIKVASEFDAHKAIGDHAYIDLVLGGRIGFRGFVAKTEKHPHILGYAQISRGPTSWGLEYVVHPNHRDGDIEIQLVNKALEEIELQGGGHVHLWIPKPSPKDDKIAESIGLKKGRDLFQMRAVLTEAFDSGKIPCRPFQPEDTEQWLLLNNEAFKNHPEQGNWDKETLRSRQMESWYSDEDFLIFDDPSLPDGRLAASCWIKLHDDDETITGEIYVVSVSPDLQNTGFGKKVVACGLNHILNKGIHNSMLYVDSDNLPALKIYRDLGFNVDHIDRAYVYDVPTPTSDPTP